MNAIGQLRALSVVLVPEDYRQFALMFGLMLASALLQVSGIASILPFMQLVARPEAANEVALLRWVFEAIGFESHRNMLLFAGATVFILFSASVLLTLFVGWFVQRSASATVHRMGVRQLQIFLQLPYEFFMSNSSAELLRKVVADINLLQSEVLLAGSQLLAQIVLAAGLLALLMLVDPTLTVLAFAVFAVLYSGMHWLRHAYLVRLGERRVLTDDQRYTAFLDAVTGMKAIRSSHARCFFLDRFAAASTSFATLPPQFHLATNIPRHLMEIVAFGGILAVVLHLVASGGDLVAALPVLTLFALATYRLMPALHTIFESVASLSKSLPVIASVARDFQSEEALEPMEDLAASPPMTFQDRIEFNNLGFKYRNAPKPSLEGIATEILAGQQVAFVGSTGAGKTTLVDLLVGLLLPSTGTLSIDGVALTAENVATWRPKVAYVPQDVFLYDDSIANNIFFGHSVRDDKKLHRAVEVACLSSFVFDELPDGLDTLVGERGIRLSGGQRQRIGLARAIYREPGLLVLDEATSALDGVTEEAVMSKLRSDLNTLTIVIVAHRLSTVRNCDKVVLLSEGKLSASGTFEELYASSPEFRRFADLARQHASEVDALKTTHGTSTLEQSNE